MDKLQKEIVIKLLIFGLLISSCTSISTSGFMVALENAFNETFTIISSEMFFNEFIKSESTLNASQTVIVQDPIDGSVQQDFTVDLSLSFIPHDTEQDSFESIQKAVEVLVDQLISQITSITIQLASDVQTTPEVKAQQLAGSFEKALTSVVSELPDQFSSFNIENIITKINSSALITFQDIDNVIQQVAQNGISSGQALELTPFVEFIVNSTLSVVTSELTEIVPGLKFTLTTAADEENRGGRECIATSVMNNDRNSSDAYANMLQPIFTAVQKEMDEKLQTGVACNLRSVEDIISNKSEAIASGLVMAKPQVTAIVPSSGNNSCDTENAILGDPSIQIITSIILSAYTTAVKTVFPDIPKAFIQNTTDIQGDIGLAYTGVTCKTDNAGSFSFDSCEELAVVTADIIAIHITEAIIEVYKCEGCKLC